LAILTYAPHVQNVRKLGRHRFVTIVPVGSDCGTRIVPFGSDYSTRIVPGGNNSKLP